MAKTRLEQFGEGSLIHIIHRGTRESVIVKDENDKWHFLLALYFLNDKTTDQHWKEKFKINLKSVRSDLTDFEEIKKSVKTKQQNRETYVDILAYCLMSNHFHLFVFVKNPNDVGRFMQRFSASLAMRFNKKYKTKGGLFESKYKVSTIKNDLHWDLVIPYIIYKNPCELFRGGIKSAIKNPDVAFRFASNYEFGSLGDLLQNRPQSAIISTNRLYGNFEIPKDNETIKKWCVRYLQNRFKEYFREVRPHGIR